jgi:predicted dehydrogenase
MGAFDRDPARMAAFCAHWNVPALPDMAAVFGATPRDGVILNLTNPASHVNINRACLDAGFHVWSEKPLALDMDDARALTALAATKGLMLGSAPCSVLGQTAQTLIRAVRDQTAGATRLIYAELDDGFIPQAPVKDWISASGAPWPYEDEFRTGCTLEHAGYYLSWLIAMFGTVRSVTAASASVIPDKLGVTGTAPDFSTAVLFFEAGPVARLTCSIAAPHNHHIRVVGDNGILDVSKAWDNSAPVRFKRRFRLRRRLMEHPWGQTLRPVGPPHPKVKRTGAAAMNFALGPAEMLRAIASGTPSRLAGDYALHLNEVTLAIQNAGEHSGSQVMSTSCPPMEPMTWG